MPMHIHVEARIGHWYLLLSLSALLSLDKTSHQTGTSLLYLGGLPNECFGYICIYTPVLRLLAWVTILSCLCGWMLGIRTEAFKLVKESALTHIAVIFPL